MAAWPVVKSIWCAMVFLLRVVVDDEHMNALFETEAKRYLMEKRANA
jgi:hypothetical protein